MLRYLILSCMALLLQIQSSPVSAHFLLNLNVRIFHVEHRNDGLDIYIRMPMPYLVADKTGPLSQAGLPAPAPYTTNTKENDQLVHYVDFLQLQNDSAGLGEILQQGIGIDTPEGELSTVLSAVRVYPLEGEPPFATLAEARQSFESDQPIPTGKLYVGDAVVDVRLSIRPGGPVGAYSLSANLNPGLPTQADTANLILDHGPGGTDVYRSRGLLLEPVEVSRSRWDGFATFTKEGIRHILEGLDHVLFVLCLVAGAATLHSLVWRVTGFTLGHSVTLSAGFFGYVPSAGWFVPTVEMGIALSIVYAALIALVPKFQTASSEKSTFLITTGIGLLHGLGFSFVLHNILKVSSPNIWQSLLAFNIGVEIGQLLIVAALGFLLWLVAGAGKLYAQRLRQGIAFVAGIIAIPWVFERAALISGAW